ncbi:MAG: hypothetical protein HN427_01320 [Flavobacteriales bacterium]|nr:hypothetical protein [Flavobacteriales bacterium]
MKFTFIKKILLFTISSIIFFSCKHDLEKPTWEVNMMSPIAHSEMSIENMISDSTTTLTNEEGLIALIFEMDLMDMSFDSLIKIDAITDEQTHTLDSASFADVVIADTATIGEAINEIPLGTILLPDGSTNSIPAMPGIANGDTINIDASEYFETMTLYRGMLTIELSNGYPTDISNVNLLLINATNQNTIATFSFPLIPSGTVVSDSVSIAGQTIDENLLAVLENMDINASNGPVLIDYSDAIITTVTISDIGITESTAIFPEQQLTENLKEHSFNLGTAQIEEIGIKSGTVTIYILSTLPNGKMIYNIPSLTKNGIAFTSGDMIIPEATSTSLTAFEFDFEGYVLNLTGQDGRLGGDTINTIYTEAYTFIDSTGELVTLNQADSFYSYIHFNLVPEYAKGYLGQDTMEFGNQQEETNMFNNIINGILDLKDATLNLSVDNFIGADVGFLFSEFNTDNTSNNNPPTNAGTDQYGDNIIGKEYTITRAVLSSGEPPMNPTHTKIELDASNMLEILPDIVNYSATFYLNPDGQQSTQDFIYPDYPIKATFDATIPLSFIANNLTFTDTNSVNLNTDSDLEIDELYITIKNGLPLTANIIILMLDAENNVLDTLINSSVITATTNQNNMVTSSSVTNITIENKDYDNLSKLVNISSFTTSSLTEHVNIYSSYKMDISIAAKFRKTIGE